MMAVGENKNLKTNFFMKRIMLGLLLIILFMSSCMFFKPVRKVTDNGYDEFMKFDFLINAFEERENYYLIKAKNVSNELYYDYLSYLIVEKDSSMYRYYVNAVGKENEEKLVRLRDIAVGDTVSLVVFNAPFIPTMGIQTVEAFHFIVQKDTLWSSSNKEDIINPPIDIYYICNTVGW